ncbi:MerR family transcriptional regulator [Salimicrobium flavidum]|uniref:DNA-binding transcriptional regulator, MerR family n=1 Tax=Salimicrobium flavidum TaxID=570947 RepID=A0A1N7J9P3_9BACI|nr:MerR family transcriptional regulator [Salimicrobium flavidum]SIS45956.1 DNA-binding transcriptional regulator, MerR family [Salimicrobium flavidum]
MKQERRGADILTKELADLAGISVRTLHYYDTIGMLVPERSSSGYRIYKDEHVQLLQQILFFRELGFSLEDINDIVHSDSFDVTEALHTQRQMMEQKKQRFERMIEKIDETIDDRRGAGNMMNEDKFRGVDFSKNPYEQEAREKWGDRAVDDANEKMRRFDNKELEEKWDAMFQDLATLRHNGPESTDAQEKIGEFYRFLNDHFGTYSPDMFRGLGEMYVADERFTENIDRYGQGLAVFMNEAMAVWAKKQK